MWKNFEEELQDIQPTHELVLSQSNYYAHEINDELIQNSKSSYDEKKIEKQINNMEKITTSIRNVKMGLSRNEFLTKDRTLPTPNANKDTVKDGKHIILLSQDYFRLLPPESIGESNNENTNQITNNSHRQNEISTATGDFTDNDNASSIDSTLNSNRSSLYTTTESNNLNISGESSSSYITACSNSWFESESEK